MGRRKERKDSRKDKKISKKTKRDFELLGGTSVFVAATLVISIFLGSSLDVVLIRSQQYASVVAAVLTDLANKDRGENKLGDLKINPTLTKAAQLKADDMAKKGYFAHTSPGGIEPWHWFEEAGYRFSYAGENLAIDFSDSSAVNDAWMNSPTHRANILDQHYTEIGIATAEGMYQGHLTTFVVQEFGTPLDDARGKPPIKKTVATNVPSDATKPATASTQVLGESTQPAPADDTQAAATSPTVSVTYASPAEHALASPNQSLKYIYYGFAVLVLLLLVIATGFELHVRHLKKAAAAGGLVTLMIALFIAGNGFIFTSPHVPDANMAAAATSLHH